MLCKHTVIPIVSNQRSHSHFLASPCCLPWPHWAVIRSSQWKRQLTVQVIEASWLISIKGVKSAFAVTVVGEYTHYGLKNLGVCTDITTNWCYQILQISNIQYYSCQYHDTKPLLIFGKWEYCKLFVIGYWLGSIHISYGKLCWKW